MIYRQRFRAASAGAAAFSIGVSSRFYDGGPSVTPVWTQGITLVIGNVTDVSRPPHAERGFVLETPRPNPMLAGSGASVAFTLPEPAAVALELFDLQGRIVARHDGGDAPAGRSAVRWTVPPLPAGRYELLLRANGRIVGRTTWVLLR